MHGWRGAHAWCVRDERALHACARVQGAGQRVRAWQWRGEARCATCLFVRLFFPPEQKEQKLLLKSKKREACIYRTQRLKRHRQPTSLRSWLVLLGSEATPVATLHSVVD